MVDHFLFDAPREDGAQNVVVAIGAVLSRFAYVVHPRLNFDSRDGGGRSVGKAFEMNVKAHHRVLPSLRVRLGVEFDI